MISILHALPGARRTPQPRADATVTTTPLDLEVGQAGLGKQGRVEAVELVRQEDIKLVQRVFLSPSPGPRRSVLFAGVERENGCTGVCIRAGQTLARLKPQSVCVVDANLRLLPSDSSPSDPDLLLTPDRVRPRMEELRGRFDYVLINAPPINLYAESLALTQFVDGVVLVLEAHTTRRESVRSVKSRLEDLKVPLLGIVLNNRTFPIPSLVYRYL